MIGKFQHTAARRRLLSHIDWMRARYKVSTHSRSKAAANKNVSQLLLLKFQHTAARRRLPLSKLNRGELNDVSTHSRPKAAAFVAANFACVEVVSTHSRPKAAAAMFSGV